MGAATSPIDFGELTPTLALGLVLLSRVLPLALLLPAAAPRASVSGVAALCVSAALGVALLPLALTSPHPALALDATLLPCVVAELLRGALLGLAVTLPLHAFAWAGELVDLARVAPGLQLDASADGGLPVSQLYRYAALAICFASGSHLLVLGAFADSLRSAPLGSLPNGFLPAGAVGSALPELVHALVSIVTEALRLSLELAAPVFLGGLVLVLMLGLIGRVSSSLILPLAQGPLLPVLGLGIVCLSASLVLPQAPAAIEVFVQHAARILRAFG